MTKPTYSPGPWDVEHDQANHGENLCICFGGGNIIARTPGSRPGSKERKQDETNARLIAAAPEMFEALRWFTRCVSMPGPVGTTALPNRPSIHGRGPGHHRQG